MSTSTDWSDGTYPGSKGNPFIINVDPDHPERHFMFDVQHVPRIEHNGWAREGFHIRTTIGVEDEACWKAVMDPEDESHAMLIQGRSRRSECDRNDLYHRHDICHHTHSAHENTSKDIAKDPSRQIAWHKLVWDESIALHSSHLRGTPST